MQHYTNEIRQDDEIDLFELFKTIWLYRHKILLATTCFFMLGFIYTMIATPWYKASALIEVGFYKDPKNETSDDVLLAKTSEVVEKLKIKYIDILEDVKDRDEITESISEIKNNPKFFNITTFGKSNEKASNLIKKIVEDVAIEHKNILDGYLNSQRVTLANTDRQIDFLKNNRIVEVEQQIRNIKNITIPRIDRQINYLENNTIPSAKRDIDNINQVSIPTIDKKIAISESDAQRYFKNLDEVKTYLKTARAEDKVLLYIQEQNLNSQISSSKEHAITLGQQKEFLLSQTILELNNRLDKLTNIDLVNMQAEIDKIRNDTLPSLQRQLYTLQTQELNSLLDKRSLIELSLQPYNYKNTSIVSDIIMSQNPQKPKKFLIWAISLVFGLVVSAFGALIYDMTKTKTKTKTI